MFGDLDVMTEGLAVLEAVDLVGPCLAGLHADEGAALAGLQFAREGPVFVEPVRHDGFALGGGEDLVAQSDQAA